MSGKSYFFITGDQIYHGPWLIANINTSAPPTILEKIEHLLLDYPDPDEASNQYNEGYDQGYDEGHRDGEQEVQDDSRAKDYRDGYNACLDDVKELLSEFDIECKKLMK